MAAHVPQCTGGGGVRNKECGFFAAIAFDGAGWVLPHPVAASVCAMRWHEGTDSGHYLSCFSESIKKADNAHGFSEKSFWRRSRQRH